MGSLDPLEKIVSTPGVTFDDVLLLPSYSEIKRRNIDLTTKLHESITLPLPIISSPMDTVTEDKMAIALAQFGGLGVIHRNIEIEKQVGLVTEVKKTKPKDSSIAALDSKGRLLVSAAVGTGDDFHKRVKALIDCDTDIIVIDSGHGYTKFIIDAVTYLRKTYPKQIVMAGNVATYDGAKALINAGAHILRVGMGPGSICTTRIVTGMGVPQITAVTEAIRAANKTKTTVVADGGVKQIGDIAKALGFGAHAVMLGSMLARYEEAPGKVVSIKGKQFKAYRGMGSVAAMQKGAAERYGQSQKTKAQHLIAEGVEGFVSYGGSVETFLIQSSGSLRSSLYYVGAKNLKEFHEKARFIRISHAGLTESHPHTVVIDNAGENYIV